jgi:hypothetical protein
VQDTLVIIPCGQGKIWDADPSRGPTLASDAYTGVPFKVNKAYAERCGDRIHGKQAVYACLFTMYPITTI